ncbi:HEPN domain-containing protein [Caulobacter hibisci]|uniref:Apea-like HEPN domain-containing protein n=1 Tax=Caulobacter hibisci TaxID=2035993 RepID=A0ABS0SSX7_9CAUL|nr:HEPN domain-containing protein [Caulobacter hibisci]MBI1682688.1 hypothetical protein [Caulobacter hibisci]
MIFKPKQRTKLLVSLKYALEQADVIGNRSLPADSARRFEDALGALDLADRERLRTYISDAPMTELIYGFLLPRFRHLEPTPDSRAPLSSIPEFSNLDALAEEIVVAMETLPWSYRFTMELPAAVSARLPLDFAWDLGDGVSIARGKGVAGRYLDPDPRDRGETTPIFPLAGATKAQLLVGVEGVVNVWQGTRPYFLGLDRTKAILGLMLALELTAYSIPEWDREETYAKAHIFQRQADDTYRYETSAHFGRALSDTILTLSIGPGADVTSRAAWGRTIGGKISAISRVLRAPEATRERLLLGAQWFFESRGGDSQLLCFIQTMVCLEILVGEELKGDQPKLGISELIRNRVAYLIGKDMTERNHILETFGTIYKVRSEIVHRGHSRLTPEQERHHATLRSYCARVLRAEVALLRSETDPPDDHWLDDLLGDPGADPLKGMYDARRAKALLDALTAQLKAPA